MHIPLNTALLFSVALSVSSPLMQLKKKCISMIDLPQQLLDCYIIQGVEKRLFPWNKLVIGIILLDEYFGMATDLVYTENYQLLKKVTENDCIRDYRQLLMVDFFDQFGLIQGFFRWILVDQITQRILTYHPQSQWFSAQRIGHHE